MTRALDIVICIGAAKAGTTWLSHFLRSHPQCQVRHLKEIYYFGRHEGLRGTIARRNAFIGRQSANKILDADGKVSNVEFNRLRDIIEWNECLGGAETSGDAYRTYLSMRAELDPKIKVCCDITPGYAHMSPESFEDMAKAVPDARYIFMLREPVSRLWSHCGYAIREDQGKLRQSNGAKDSKHYAADLTTGEVARKFLDQEGTFRQRFLKFGNYEATLQKLTAVVRPEQIFIGFYERLVTPDQIADLSKFLGIDVIPFDGETRKNAGNGEKIPNDIRREAARFFAKEYAAVANFVGNDMPQEWREMQQIALEKAVA